ncbi:hypothetical protein HDU98_000394 [Podochytrium sp. JEL0797]|nr:hypothetical protein HDU98_000394 [Podochytrium sp. JEL0797]
MVKLFESTHVFAHSWESGKRNYHLYLLQFEISNPTNAVTFSIFNKYPNPFASHVLTADVIDRHWDPDTGILHTTRLFTKEGRLPKWSTKMFKIKEAYILEISELNPTTKTLKTVTRNLSHAKLMLVEETQTVTPAVAASTGDSEVVSIPGTFDKGSFAGGGGGGETAIHITARIISNMGWPVIQKRIEAFGASKIRENTMRSSIGLMHVIEDMKRRKLIS